MSEDDDVGYESGPFCRHWYEAGDCDYSCAVCGHGCTEHAAESGETQCLIPECPCVGWEQPK